MVPYIESWVDRGHTINIVYGYCERGDLSSLLGRYRQRKQPIPEANLKLWLCQCLMALEHCHSRSVLHRDIKSGNIFLTAEGNVMVGDFGLATVREGGSDEDHSLVGTPHYMSPELLAKRPYSFKSDIFSLGVVLYELSAQKPPFTAFNIHGLIHKIKRAPMPALPPVSRLPGPGQGRGGLIRWLFLRRSVPGSCERCAASATARMARVR